MAETLKRYEQPVPERLVPFERIAVKIGSSSLIDEREHRVKEEVFDGVAEQLARLHASGVQVMLITSGAVQMGKIALGSFGNGQDIIGKQLEAAVGQPLIMEQWRKSLNNAAKTLNVPPIVPCQFLPTEDTMHMGQPVMERGFERGVLPILNANDPYNDYEMRQYLKSADNDVLGGHNALEARAGAYVMLTESPGIIDRFGKTVATYDPAWMPRIRFNGNSNGGTGGARSKHNVAVECMEDGIFAAIADASAEDVIIRALRGEEERCSYYVPEDFALAV